MSASTINISKPFNFRFGSSLVTVRWAVLLLVAALFVTTLTPASDLSAAGGEIIVVTTESEVEFPGNIDLSVTAEADADIVEVRLFYRTVGSSIWAYAYPEFAPSDRVTARVNLTGDTSGYIPPGTEIEYYYEIRDSEGNLLRTDLAVLEYSDTRFDWEETTIGPLTLLYYDQSNTRVRGVARLLESDLERMQELLQIEEVDEIKGVIYARRSDAQAAFPQQSRTTTEQQIFQGFAFSERGIFLGLGMDRGLIVHESAHLLFGQALGDQARPTPSWLDEGFASYMDPSSRVFSGESLSPRTNPLRAMNTVTGTPHAIGAFYQKSLSVVAFMIDEFGEANFQEFIGQLRQGKTVDTSLLNVYGFDIDELDARWAGEAPGATAPAPSAPGSRSPSPILFFNSWLLGGLVLVVFAAVFIQFVVSKFRPAYDSEEGLQPWEDPDLWDDDDDAGWDDDRPYSR